MSDRVRLPTDWLLAGEVWPFKSSQFELPFGVAPLGTKVALNVEATVLTMVTWVACTLVLPGSMLKLTVDGLAAYPVVDPPPFTVRVTFTVA